jgi:hypothetical protein
MKNGAWSSNLHYTAKWFSCRINARIKLSHLKAAVALHFAYYNFCRVHSSIRVTPAMEAGLTDHIWELLTAV